MSAPVRPMTADEYLRQFNLGTPAAPAAAPQDDENTAEAYAKKFGQPQGPGMQLPRIAADASRVAPPDPIDRRTGLPAKLRLGLEAAGSDQDKLSYLQNKGYVAKLDEKEGLLWYNPKTKKWATPDERGITRGDIPKIIRGAGDIILGGVGATAGSAVPGAGTVGGAGLGVAANRSLTNALFKGAAALTGDEVADTRSPLQHVGSAVGDFAEGAVGEIVGQGAAKGLRVGGKLLRKGVQKAFKTVTPAGEAAAAAGIDLPLDVVSNSTLTQRVGKALRESPVGGPLEAARETALDQTAGKVKGVTEGILAKPGGPAPKVVPPKALPKPKLASMGKQGDDTMFDFDIGGKTVQVIGRPTESGTFRISFVGSPEGRGGVGTGSMRSIMREISDKMGTKGFEGNDILGLARGEVKAIPRAASKAAPAPSQFATEVSRADAAQAFARAGRRDYQRFTSELGHMEDAIGEGITSGVGKVPVNNVKKLIGDMTAEISQSPNASGPAYAPIMSRLQALAADAEKAGGIDYAVLRRFKKELGEAARLQPGQPGAISRELADAAEGAVERDISTAANAAGVGDLWRTRNKWIQFHRGMNPETGQPFRPVDMAKFQRAIRTGEDSKILGFAESGETVTGKRLWQIRRSTQKQAPGDWDIIAASKWQELGQRAPDADFDPRVFMRNWNKLSSGAKEAYWKGTRYAQQREAMENLVKVTQQLAERNVTPAAVQGAGQRGSTSVLRSALLGPWGMLSAGAAVGGQVLAGQDPSALSETALAGAAGLYFGGRGAARLMSNPRFVRWLTSTAHIPANATGQRVANAIGRLWGIAKAENIENEVREYLSVAKAWGLPEDAQNER